MRINVASREPRGRDYAVHVFGGGPGLFGLEVEAASVELAAHLPVLLESEKGQVEEAALYAVGAGWCAVGLKLGRLGHLLGCIEQARTGVGYGARPDMPKCL